MCVLFSFLYNFLFLYSILELRCEFLVKNDQKNAREEKKEKCILPEKVFEIDKCINGKNSTDQDDQQVKTINLIIPFLNKKITGTTRDELDTSNSGF